MPDTVTTSTTSLYDSTAKVFYPYTATTAYIHPYSSDRAGGELITEYNQRNALNTICKKTMDLWSYASSIESELDETFGAVVESSVSPEADPATNNTEKKSAGLYSFVNTWYVNRARWKATVYATGVQDEHDFDIVCNGNILYIKPGKAMIMGYNIESTVEVQLPLSEVLTTEDILDVKNRPQQNPPNNAIVTKFVKLVLMYTENGPHDERLNPPADGTYMSVAIVVNDELLADAGNELLLGTLTLSEQHQTYYTNNPLKTRILPLDSIAGAEGYDELINTANMQNGSIYGLTKDTAHHITDITSKLWLDSGANIAKLLRALSAQPETATTDYHKNTRGVIVTQGANQSSGDSSPAIKQALNGDYPSFSWYQAYAKENDANATIELRKQHYPFGYCDSGYMFKEPIPPPEGSTTYHYEYSAQEYPELDNITGACGFITPQQAYMLERVYATSRSVGGRQFGPFISVDEAVVWFRDHFEVEYYEGDYFWVINDVLKYSSTVSSTDNTGTAQLTRNGSVFVKTDPVSIAGTIAGNVTGTVTGTVAGTSNVTGNITGEVTSTHEAVTGTITEGTASIADATVTGNVTGTASGNVNGTLTDFDMNVSTRYVCVYAGDAPTGNKGVKMIVRGIDYDYVDAVRTPRDKYGDGHTVSTAGDAWFALQAVERGYGITASANTYGLVKTGTGNDLRDVVKDPATYSLRITDDLYKLITDNCYTALTEYEKTLMGDTGTVMEELTRYWNKTITPSNDVDSDTITFKLLGKASVWENAADIYKTLKRIRPHVIIDYSELVVDNAYQGGIIFNCIDIDYVTLRGDNRESNSNGVHTPTAPLKLGFDHCVVDTPFFENIGYWKSSSFTSGSNTIELDNPWMIVDKIFTKNDYINNKLYTRFSSVTMGEKGISSAMMDMWIQYENIQPNSNSVDRCLTSIVRVDFPPLMYEFANYADGSVTTTTQNVNLATIQKIPSEICMKIGATAGVHEVLQTNNIDTQQYQVSGNLLATVDWSYNTHFDLDSTPDEPLYLNLYMKNSSGDPLQKISNLKFRVPVQVTRIDDNSSVKYADFKYIFQRDPHPTNENENQS